MTDLWRDPMGAEGASLLVILAMDQSLRQKDRVNRINC